VTFALSSFSSFCKEFVLICEIIKLEPADERATAVTLSIPLAELFIKALYLNIPLTIKAY
jgi:hypothetical protein